jgi:chromate transporter
MLWRLTKLFSLMFGIGGLTFGGGYAIVGVLQNYLVDKLHWLTVAQFNTGLVIGQLTPGPLSTMVAFVGYQVSGVTGAVVATVGLLLPSFLSSVAIAKTYDRFKEIDWVKYAVRGISLAVVALLAGAIVGLTKGAITNIWTGLIAVATFFITGPWKKDPIWTFLAAALIGAFLFR